MLQAMQNRALGACFASIWGQVGWGDIRALSDQSGFSQWPEKTHLRERERLCMLSISVLVGLMSVIAHHSTLITSRTRLDSSLALGPSPADTVGAQLHPCSRTPPTTSLPSAPPGPYPLSHQCPIPPALSGVSQ